MFFRAINASEYINIYEPVQKLWERKKIYKVAAARSLYIQPKLSYNAHLMIPSGNLRNFWEFPTCCGRARRNYYICRESYNIMNPSHGIHHLESLITYQAIQYLVILPVCSWQNLANETVTNSLKNLSAPECCFKHIKKTVQVKC